MTGKTVVLIFDDLPGLYDVAAERLVYLAKKAVAGRGRFCLALSGGGTPRPLFERLARPPYLDQLPWSQVALFWGDERCVPPDHPESSFGQFNQLVLAHLPAPPGQVYRIRGEWEPAAAAADYTEQLQQAAGSGQPWPRFDLALLGMGEDGHVASLFPGPMSETESSRPAIAVTAEYAGRPARRVTLTPPVFNDARHILFLVTGAGKAEALAAVLEGPPDPARWPAQRIRPAQGLVMWLVDETAARSLRQLRGEGG
ncbi:MAG: 6-phosphogluconolactonase [Chloroflexi bacterium]|nr:6-phosphogluconolactonase [Chloroflexota bacterium]